MRRAVVAILVALVVAAPASAETRMLWPGVTYRTDAQFAPGGPVVINVLTGPRPGGNTTLTPVLSTNTVIGRETLTSMQRRLTGTATSAGVNGDLFSLQTGRPSGMFMRDGELQSPPNPKRSSAGVLADGTLEVRRVSWRGTWRAAGGSRPVARLNAPPPSTGSALFTPAYGRATPELPAGRAVVLFPFPLSAPDADLVASVVESVPAGPGVLIPEGGAVLVGRGPAAAALERDAPPGEELTVHLSLQPGWPGLVSAIGGGPRIVRDGAPVFAAGEMFASAQLTRRAPRSAVGQLADGRIVLIAVDGRQPGHSVGLTNFQLAQALVRYGAVTGMALDGGGSTAMAFDGSLLNRPSDGRERAIASALMFLYTGVLVGEPLPLVSPNGDGDRDRQRLSYRLVRPSIVETTLVAPGGGVAYSAVDDRPPGSYPVPFPPRPDVVTADPDAPIPGPAEGRWTLRVTATDDVARVSRMSRSFDVNSTLGYLRVARKTLYLPHAGRDLGIGWRLSRPARVTVRIEDLAGDLVARLAQRQFPAGASSLVWNGLQPDGKRVVGGPYRVRVVARNALGRVEQLVGFRVQRTAR
jgi:Phosphodiester glycosidase/FlgD Ig-like domain